MIRVFHINDKRAYKSAGSNDLIALLPAPGSNQLFIPKVILEIVCYGIVHHELIHISGPTGSAKSSLIEAFTREPENFRLVCDHLGFTFQPLKVFEIEMATFDTPSELYRRRSLNEAGTYDEDSVLVTALKKSTKLKNVYPVIFLKEMGRVHTAAIQSALLNLLSKTDIILPDEKKIPGGRVCFVADSNYQAADDSQHTLVTLDDALKRRFSINLRMDYLTEEEERSVLIHLLRNKNKRKKVNEDHIKKITKMGQMIRQYRNEGNLLSLVPPTIYGYLTCYEMLQMFPHLGIQHIASNTLLGNASKEDQRIVDSLTQNVFHSTDGFRDSESVFDDVF